jgi:hypothetical protein
MGRPYIVKGDRANFRGRELRPMAAGLLAAVSPQGCQSLDIIGLFFLRLGAGETISERAARGRPESANPIGQSDRPAPIGH